MSLATKQFHIGGMTCTNCPRKIKKALTGLAGVVAVSVSYETGIARIEFHPEEISLSRIKQVIEQLG